MQTRPIQYSLRFFLFVFGIGLFFIFLFTLWPHVVQAGHSEFECSWTNYTDVGCTGAVVNSGDSCESTDKSGCTGGKDFSCSVASCLPAEKPSSSKTRPAPTEFKCEANECGSDIKSQPCTEKKTRSVHCSCGGSWTTGSWSGWTKSCGVETTDTNCGDFQVCTGSTGFTSTKDQACQCSAALCYPVPTLRPVDDSDFDPSPPLVPKSAVPPDNLFDDDGNVKLPVDLEWNNVQAIVDSCPVNAYRYEVDEAGGGFDPPLVSEVSVSVSGDPILLNAPILFDCSLTSNETYSWRVQACRTLGPPADCTDWGVTGPSGISVDFTTSLAPGLNAPFDEDFGDQLIGGSGFAISDVPITLDWCPSTTAAESYLLNIYETCKGCPAEDDPWLPANRVITLTQSFPPTLTEYDDEVLWRILNRDNFYKWEVGFCKNDDGTDCPFFSQLWTIRPEGEYEITTLLNPPDGGAVNLLDNLNWESLSYVFTYVVRVVDVLAPVPPVVDWFSRDEQIEVKWLWTKMEPNKEYAWKVAPCFKDEDLATCQIPEKGNPDKWSAAWTFWTTGAPPTNLSVSPTLGVGGPAAIPFTLDWDNMPGAASYDIEIATDSGFGSLVTESVVKIGKGSQLFVPFQGVFDHFRQNIKYYWRVRTCADPDGPNPGYGPTEACGEWSDQSFTTVDLAPPPPVAPVSPTVGFIPDFDLDWGEVFGGNFYRYEVSYISKPAEETSSDCSTGLVAEAIIPRTSASIPAICIGTYEAQVQACLDVNCVEIGAPSIWVFEVEEPPVKESSLVPCGRVKNDDNTKWDERKPCGFQHLFLLLRNLIDFAIFRLSFIIIVVMLLVTGAVSYFSLGAPNTLAQIQSIWKAVIVGVLILLLAWLLLNLLLGFLGFNVGIFGNWYEPPI